MFRRKPHIHSDGCPGCWAEFQRKASRHYDEWTRVDSVHSYILLIGVVLITSAILFGPFLISGAMP